MSKALDVNAAIEAIADKVHQGWCSEKLAQGFADHPWKPDKLYLAYICEVCIERSIDKPYARAGSTS